MGKHPGTGAQIVLSSKVPWSRFPNLLRDVAAMLNRPTTQGSEKYDGGLSIPEVAREYRLSRAQITRFSTDDTGKGIRKLTNEPRYFRGDAADSF